MPHGYCQHACGEQRAPGHRDSLAGLNEKEMLAVKGLLKNTIEMLGLSSNSAYNNCYSQGRVRTNHGAMESLSSTIRLCY